ncbi:hypothetical protein MBLNU230_g1028t1 [Neophaeotheca triangularis]
MYRNSAAPSGRSPHATQARRGPGPMVATHPNAHPQTPAPTQAQLQAQRLEEMRRHDLVRRQSKKPTDRDIPDDVANYVVGDGVKRYKELRDAERRLDANMMRKRLDVNDNLQRRYARREGTLRVWISNTAEGQPWQVMEDGSGINEPFEFGDNSQATFRVKIEGRLLDDPDADEDEHFTTETRPKLSHFFKAITIDFDRSPSLQPDGYSSIEWRKPQQNSANYDPNSAENSFDTLEFERKGDENMNVTINLVRDERSERYKLSPALADLLDTDEEDKAGAVQGVWEYCRAMGLQEDEDKRSIVCDEPLRKLFGGKDTIYFPHVPDALMPHLHQLPPIKLSYTIRVDKAHLTADPPAATIYDLPYLPLPNPLSTALKTFHTSTSPSSPSHLASLKQMISLDDDLALLVSGLHNTNAKRTFLASLAEDPRGFVQRWGSSQKRDLEVVLAEERRSGFEDAGGASNAGRWEGERVRESVGGWVSRAGVGKA